VEAGGGRKVGTGKVRMIKGDRGWRVRVWCRSLQSSYSPLPQCVATAASDCLGRRAFGAWALR
jgi:hypothetical protein